MKKIIAWNKGKKLSKIHRRRLSKAHVGLVSGMKGKKCSEEHKAKLSISHKGKKVSAKTIEKLKRIAKEKKYGNWMVGKKASEETKRKMRISHLKYIEETRGRIAPNVGRTEKEILDSLEELFGYKIIRHFFIDGYFLDGYCQELNLAIEIDEEGHFKNKTKLMKDSERQQRIEKLLNCKFLRIREKFYLQFKSRFARSSTW